jgi:hypothetical protein
LVTAQYAHPDSEYHRAVPTHQRRKGALVALFGEAAQQVAVRDSVITEGKDCLANDLQERGVPFSSHKLDSHFTDRFVVAAVGTSIRIIAANGPDGGRIFRLS